MSELSSVGPAEKKKLDDTITAVLRQLDEIQDIRESIKDLIKNVSEELNIKPKSLRSAALVAHKAKLAEKKEEHDTMCEILELTGRG
jgi:uncharacterized iron-regulated protein